jgi:heparan-alpha-glucosaminide N-acetyltransferase
MDFDQSPTVSVVWFTATINLMTASAPPPTETRGRATPLPVSSAPLASIHALRGLVMFTMIFVNDLAGVPDRIVPAWMKHFHGKSGMTFVDLVFPAFLFIVGMSIPLALGSRLNRGEPVWRIVLHVLTRTASLLFIGILMVNETPDPVKMGWSGALWSALMYSSAIFAFCDISPASRVEPPAGRARNLRFVSLGLRLVGWGSLACLAVAFRGADGHRIISFAPFLIHTEWYGILGLIGWAYLVGSLVFLVFRCRSTALLGCAVLLLCVYAADKQGAFAGCRLSRYVGIGTTLGSQPAITVAGVLLAVNVLTAAATAFGRGAPFTVLYIAGCATAAWLLNGLYGINKNNATPSWCLWACAITAALWLLLHFLADLRPTRSLAGPLVVAGQNVLVAYLLSEMLPSALDLFHLNTWYDGLAEPNLLHAVLRSAGCAMAILGATAGLNRIGFRLKL